MKLFDSEIKETTNTCRKCKHNEAWECNSKVFHYCGVRRSNRTSNGKLKIKCKNIACWLFEKS